MDFISLNSWQQSGTIYQGENPVAKISGGPGEWEKLRHALAHYRSESDTPHPTGAAIGWIAYDGSYSFGIYPQLQTVSGDWNNPLWQRRRALADQPLDLSLWQADISPQEFEERVRRAQDYIVQGDIYQVNLAHRFHCDFRGNPYALFEQLMWRSPAPGGAFLDMGGQQILSSSPELFIRLEGRRLVTRPIKGTRPRDRDPTRDQQLAYELMTDPKELAELVMITDLERNDLGKICDYGSVQVSQLCHVESYPQVHHLVSTVEGHLRAGLDAVDAVAACYPGGSITGAPKKRAMEIIAELEPRPRGLYTGAIGYFGFNGDAAFSITIRTLILENGQLHFHVGSGITADSVPEREYQETLHKARGMKLAVESLATARHPLLPSLIH
jgi:para-aminobenzoate synthetase component I